MSTAVGGIFCEWIRCSKRFDGIGETPAPWLETKEEGGGVAAAA